MEKRRYSLCVSLSILPIIALSLRPFQCSQERERERERTLLLILHQTGAQERAVGRRRRCCCSILTIPAAIISHRAPGRFRKSRGYTATLSDIFREKERRASASVFYCFPYLSFSVLFLRALLYDRIDFCPRESRLLCRSLRARSVLGK